MTEDCSAGLMTTVLPVTRAAVVMRRRRAARCSGAVSRRAGKADFAAAMAAWAWAGVAAPTRPTSWDLLEGLIESMWSGVVILLLSMMRGKERPSCWRTEARACFID